MDVTDIPASKAPPDDRNPACLHCVVMTAIEGHFKAHGRRVQGQYVIDVMEVLSKLAECTVEIVNSLPERSKRRRAMRLAHDALDACVKSQQSGKLVSVDVPVEH